MQHSQHIPMYICIHIYISAYVQYLCDVYIAIDWRSHPLLSKTLEAFQILYNYIYTHQSIFIYIHMHVYEYVYKYIIHAYIHIPVYMYVYAHMHICAVSMSCICSNRLATPRFSLPFQPQRESSHYTSSPRFSLGRRFSQGCNSRWGWKCNVYKSAARNVCNRCAFR